MAKVYKTKLQNRRAFQGGFGLGAAPVLEFHLIVLVNPLVKS